MGEKVLLFLCKYKRSQTQNSIYDTIYLHEVQEQTAALWWYNLAICMHAHTSKMHTFLPSVQ